MLGASPAMDCPAMGGWADEENTEEAEEAAFEDEQTQVIFIG